jgi:integrase
MNPNIMIWPVIFPGPEGERLPVIKDRATGVPLFLPTIYTLEMQRGNSFYTIEKRLGPILFLYTWSEITYRKHFKVHETPEQNEAARYYLEKRFAKGQFLTLGEINNLIAVLRKNYELYCRENFAEIAAKVISLKREKKLRQGISRQTQRDNVDWATKYIDWMSDYWLARMECSGNYSASQLEAYKANRELMLKRMRVRKPKAPESDASDAREGIPAETQLRMMEIIKPESPQNPWKDEAVKLRNQLFVTLALYLGVRRGELLALYVVDVDTQANRVAIVKGRSKKDDPRRRPQQTKSRKSRKIILSRRIAPLVQDYLMFGWPKMPGARNSPFLFLASDTGRPMSPATAEDIFNQLADRLGVQRKLFSPHILRHTCADNISRAARRQGLDSAQLVRKLMLWFGWKDPRQTDRYTQLSAQEEVNRTIAKLQDEMYSGFLTDLPINP